MQSQKPTSQRSIESDLSSAEAEGRRDEILKRVLQTPPQPRPKRERDNPKPTGKRKPAK